MIPSTPEKLGRAVPEGMTQSNPCFYSRDCFVIPTTIGRYSVIKEEGRSSAGVLYRAFDEQLSRPVMINLAHDVEDADQEVRNGARTLAALQHPSIVNVLDIGIDSGRTFSVFEHLPSSLGQELELRTLSFGRIADIIANAGEALDFVHRRGYLHRGIRPRAILLDPLGLPKLWGFEKAIKNLDFLPSGIAIGTLTFMAPEEVRGQRIGVSTDIWAMGMTMYSALTGEMPFRGDTTAQLMEGILSIEPPGLTELVPGIPSELERICLRCLRKAPDDRFPTAQLFTEALREWQRGTFKTPARVFISHSSQDRDFVESMIVSPLERCAIKTWYSKAEIQTAAEWERSIKKGLESCEWFLIVLSKRALQSEWVKDELYWAIENRPERIIPVQIDGCNVADFHIRLARIQRIDFDSDAEKLEQRLVQAISHPTS